MQIAAANRATCDEKRFRPPCWSRSAAYAAQAANSGKATAGDREDGCRQGRSSLSTSACSSRAFIKDPDKQVGQLISDAVAKLGENVVVRRFARFQLSEQSSTDWGRRWMRGRRLARPAARHPTCAIGAYCSS
jgi:hypothetical protein